MNLSFARRMSLCLLVLLGACGGKGGDSSSATTPTNPTPTLLSIAVTPAMPTIQLGTSQQFVATGTYSDGKSAAVTAGVTWSVGGSGAASAYSLGSVKGVAIGSDTVTATVGTVHGSTTLTVKGPYVAVASGGTHTVVRKADGTLSAWGTNRTGQLGDGTNDSKTVATPVYGAYTTWASISAGELHTLALKDVKNTGGSLYAWGYNFNGQLGTTSGDKIIPTLVGAEKTWTAISAGGNHSAALKAAGTLWTWGRNVDGQLGDSTTWLDKAAPAQVKLTPAVATANAQDSKWTAVSAGSNFTVARQSDGTVYSWGGNAQGQLGNLSVGTSINVPTQIIAYTDDATNAVPVKDSSGAIVPFTALSLSAGGFHVLAINAKGALYTWGANDFGQLGLWAISVPMSNPSLVPNPNANYEWALISAGNAHSVGIMTDGTLWAWGDNSDGQLGDPTLTSGSVVPAPIMPEIKDWIYVSAGKNQTFAIRADGSLWGWGRNAEWQLGAISTALKVMVPTMYP